MKKILFIIIFLSGINLINAQTWRQYNLATGQITDISFTYSSSETSNSKPGSRGILPDNFSPDTSRTFFPLDIINDPNAYPWRTIVKFNDVTGFLIDPYHVLTAGHAIEFHPYFQTVIFIPGYESGDMPYSYAYAEYFYLLSDYFPGTSKDFAIVKLDRPIGALSGWNGYGYNNSNEFFQNNNFFNPSYPSQLPYNGLFMFNWKGNFTSISTDYFISTRRGAGGMSGSPVFTNVNNDNIAYGILTNLGVKFNRITANKFDALNKIIDLNTPAQFDLIPLNVTTSPVKVKSGDPLEQINFVLHNYSSENKSNANITVNVYLSPDQTITSSDELLATYNYQKNFGAKNSEYISQASSLPVINKTPGDYYIGVIVSGDINSANNTTKTPDVSKISVASGDLYSIKGRITSSQIGNGISGVNLNGFPTEVKTDFYGNYETQVSSGWSGTVTPVKSGFDFINSSVTYSPVTQNITTNYSASKRILNLSGTIKSPVAHTPIVNTKLTGLPGEPYTDAAGNYSVNIFYGWAGTIQPYNPNELTFSPFTEPVNNLTSGRISNFTGGYYIDGRTYDNNGGSIAGVILQGFPGSVATNEFGEYSVFLDSGWTGTVTPLKSGITFIPSQRNYVNLNASFQPEDYVELKEIVINLKVLLTGAVYDNSDTMRTSLNYKNNIPLVPPDTLGGNESPFIYFRNQSEITDRNFLNSHPDIVDWIIIEIRDSKDFAVPIDTIAAFLRNDGRVLSVLGDSLVPLKIEIVPDNYYIIIRHRNHIAVMSNNPVFLNSFTELYDFTLGAEMYYGNQANQLSNGKYALYPGDADRNGNVNILDYQIFKSESISANTGYIFSDFNLDGLLTGSDFNIFAPVNKNHAKTNVPNSIPSSNIYKNK
ncbi:MAG: hypothetical protein HY959_02800 [Ignavibacteriae bacterium]|nr:hypothetical protein [Ignavibacteriota bacterium]